MQEPRRHRHVDGRVTVWFCHSEVSSLSEAAPYWATFGDKSSCVLSRSCQETCFFQIFSESCYHRLSTCHVILPQMSLFEERTGYLGSVVWPIPNWNRVYYIWVSLLTHSHLRRQKKISVHPYITNPMTCLQRQWFGHTQQLCVSNHFSEIFSNSWHLNWVVRRALPVSSLGQWFSMAKNFHVWTPLWMFYEHCAPSRLMSHPPITYQISSRTCSLMDRWISRRHSTRKGH
jgi:hypothetical protein